MGILKQLHARSEFSAWKERTLTKEDGPALAIVVCQTAIKLLRGNGQECDCSKSKCTTNGCSLCNSKCTIFLLY